MSISTCVFPSPCKSSIVIHLIKKPGLDSEVLKNYRPVSNLSFLANRKSIHKRARCGSGGVCLFVKLSMLLNYNVSLLDNSYEDILWVKFEHKYSLQCINVCVCYLSPEGSSHIVDPHQYYDQLLSQIYIYQTTGPFMLCGDFNSRCGG